MWVQRRVKKRSVVCLCCTLGGLCWLVVCLLDPHTMLRMRRDEGEDAPTQPAPQKTQDVGGLPKGFYTVVHLDLKGAPPKLSYLKTLLPLLARQGANALLVEYEDMFPYSGRLANISAKNAYSKRDIGTLLKWAAELKMEVIPLVQTFGHLEFALKLDEFRSLRELTPFPQEVCPSKPEAATLVEEMVGQVMALHPSANYLHIGCDEVFHLAACPLCSQLQLNSREIYSNYVTKVAEHVRTKYKVTPIIWDDMMRQWPPHFLASNPLTSLVEPMVWVYTTDVNRLLPHYVWHWYGKSFPRVWVAAAFKGATYPTSVLPDMERHFANQQSWLSYVRKPEPKVAGLVLTGWSRYDHFAVLCELLPAAVPSLFLALSLVKTKVDGLEETEVFPRWRKSLRCSSSSTFSVYSLKYDADQRQLASCDFPGVDVYNAVLNYLVLRIKIDSLINTMTETNAWLTSYNVRHNFTSPWRLVDDYKTLDVNTVRRDLAHYKNDTRTKLLRYFDDHTAAEWLEQKVQPMEVKLSNIARVMENLLRREVWPRRPFR